MRHRQDQQRAYPDTGRLDAYPEEKVRPSYTRPYQPSRPAPQTRAPRGNTRNLRDDYNDYSDYEEAPRPRRRAPAQVPAQLHLYAISMFAYQEEIKRGLFGGHAWEIPHHEVHLATASSFDEAYSQAEEDIYTVFPEEDGFSGHSVEVREVSEDFIAALAANRQEIALALQGRFE